MIVINKDSGTNKIALELRQFQTVETDTFLFEFTNDFTRESFQVNLEDVSTYKQRSNIFCIDGSLFSLAGSWHFAVYQNPDEETETTNLKMVGYGMLKVTQNSIPIEAYTNQQTINPVYNG